MVRARGFRSGPMLLMAAPLALAGPEAVEVTVSSGFYYTDDVAIFSATERLSLNADPTQPALDEWLTGQGDDGVYEPVLKLAKAFTSGYGTTRLEATGDGFVFMNHTRFTHGTLRLEASQDFTPETTLHLIYYYSPDLYLGENFVRQPIPENGEAPAGFEGGPTAAEILTSHIVSVRLDQALTETLEIQLLARYGARRYDPAFAERDLNFWTLGPHLCWQVSPGVSWLVGYHFEEGKVLHSTEFLVADDVSYDNNFLSTELEYEFAEDYRLTVGLHYEINNWLSRQTMDIRYGTHETIYQGEMLLSHTLTAATRVYGGFQYSTRLTDNDTPSINTFNVQLGVEAQF